MHGSRVPVGGHATGTPTRACACSRL